MLSLLLSRLNCCREPELDERHLVTISYRDEAETDPPPRQAPPPRQKDPEVPVLPLELKVDSLEDPDAKTKDQEDPQEEAILEVEIDDGNLPESKGEFVVGEEVVKDPKIKNKKDQKESEEYENTIVVKKQEMPQEDRAKELASAEDAEGRTTPNESSISYQKEEAPKRQILFYLLPMRIDAEEPAIN